MDIKPSLTPRQEYAIQRISEIVKNNPPPPHQYKIKCCYKMAISALAMLAAGAIMPLEVQENLHFMHVKMQHNQYTSPVEIVETAAVAN